MMAAGACTLLPSCLSPYVANATTEMERKARNRGALRKESNATTEMEREARNRGALRTIEHTAFTIKKNYKGFENIGKVFWIY